MKCDKCGKDVPPNNDATILAMKVDERMGMMLPRSRHLLPVFVDGEQVCEGSPSRARYLEGQPPDPRYPYHPEDEVAWRAAYAEMLAEA